jgi:5-methylcytosine-specific restriction endonuclease McrA
MSKAVANERRLNRIGPWRKLRDRVIREEPICRIQLLGCTGYSTTADHIIPRSVRPDLILVRSNLRGACQHCNSARGNAMRAPRPVVRPRKPRQVEAFFSGAAGQKS